MPTTPGQTRVNIIPTQVALQSLRWATVIGAALLASACGDPNDNAMGDGETMVTATTPLSTSSTTASPSTSTVVSTSAPTASSSTTTTTSMITTTTAGPMTSAAPMTTAAPVMTTPGAGYLDYAVFEPGIFRGVGEAVVDIAAFSTVDAIVRAHHDGSGEFSVYTVDQNGDRMGRIVQSVGNVDGLYPLGWGGLDRMLAVPHDADVQPTQLDVRADGAWTIEIRPLAEIELWDGSERSGRDSDIMIWSGPESLMEYSTTHADFLLQIEQDSGIATLSNTTAPAVVGGAGVEYIPFGDGIVRVSAFDDGIWTIKTTPKDEYCESITPETHMSDPERAKFCPKPIGGGG